MTEQKLGTFQAMIIQGSTQPKLFTGQLRPLEKQIPNARIRRVRNKACKSNFLTSMALQHIRN